jgi:hypothetical protein
MTSFYNSSSRIEGNVSILNYQGDITAYTVSAGTITMSITSALHTVFSGSTAGQILNLGDATQYQNGHEWWIYNKSTTFISIRDNSNTELLNMPTDYRLKVVLQSNSTSTGVWIIGMLGIASAAGRLVALFSNTANSVSNKFLDTENIASSDTLPAVAVGGVLGLLTFSGQSTTPSGTIEIRINTTTGTPAATVTLVGTQTQVSTISVPVFAGDFINCKVGAGAANIQKPLVKLYSI